MVGLTAKNGFVTAHSGLELLTRQNGSPKVLVSLLCVLHDPESESSQLGALASMETFFLDLFRAGGLKEAAVTKQNCSTVGFVEMDVDDRAHWTSKAYSAYVNTLLELLVSTGVSRTVHVRSLVAIMELVRSETPGLFSNSLYARLCAALVGSKGPINSIVAVLASEFFQYGDVRYFTYVNVRKLAAERTVEKEDNSRRLASLQMFVRNLYELLSHLPTTLTGDSGNGVTDSNASEKSWCHALLATATSKVDSKGTANQWSDERIQKEAFTKSWRAFVRLSQPLGAHKKDYGHLLSHNLTTANMTAPRDSFLTSISDDVDERLKDMAVCKESTADNANPDGQLGCGGDATSDWVLSAARGKEEDDDDDHDDDDDDDDEDEDDDDDDEEEEEDDDNKVDGGGDEEDVEGEEEEADNEEGDDDGEADDNGEDDDGDEEGDDEDVDGDADEDEDEEDDEDGDQDAEDEDEDEAEGESEEDVEPPKKKRK